VDLYSAALRFCAKLKFEDLQTSTMIGILRTVHNKAMQDRQCVSQACKHFNDLILAHSIHRPPWSVCTFSLEQMKQVTDWIHAHYLTNFHCFLYVYTPCTTVSFTSVDPRQRIETPPVALPALAEAIDEDAHKKQLAVQRAKEAEEDAKAAAKVCVSWSSQCPAQLSGLIWYTCFKCANLHEVCRQQSRQNVSERLEYIRNTYPLCLLSYRRLLIVS
jgi:hypothetical protein